jgi:hypothetical protein
MAELVVFRRVDAGSEDKRTFHRVWAQMPHFASLWRSSWSGTRQNPLK